MDNKTIILIDIREEFELLESHIESKDDNVLILNIPMRAMFANKRVLEKLSETHKIYLVCKSGNRTGKVKEKYFPTNDNIISLDGGVKALNENKVFQDRVEIISGKGGMGLGVQQYIQIAFIMMLFMLLVLTHLDVKKMHMEIIIACIILFITYQILSKGCLISSMIPLSSHF